VDPFHPRGFSCIPHFTAGPVVMEPQRLIRVEDALGPTTAKLAPRCGNLLNA
jgi:hypothetical protein